MIWILSNAHSHPEIHFRSLSPETWVDPGQGGPAAVPAQSRTRFGDNGRSGSNQTGVRPGNTSGRVTSPPNITNLPIINQSIIRFVLRHSTTVLVAQDNVITTGKKDVSSIMI